MLAAGLGTARALLIEQSTLPLHPHFNHAAGPPSAPEGREIRVVEEGGPYASNGRPHRASQAAGGTRAAQALLASLGAAVALARSLSG